MCTVSYYKDAQKTIITSNRDEHISRPTAESLKEIMINNEQLIYPQDPQAGGTWFVVKNFRSVFVLLNGAKKKHISKPPYRKSRGLILLDITRTKNILETWHEINLSNIEPFTIVAFDNGELSQLFWNGHHKSLMHLTSKTGHIWSSTTLYNEEVIQKRKDWFSEFLKQKEKNISADDFIHFHIHTQKNDLQNGLVINRDQTMLTKNVTQCVIGEKKNMLIHFDLIANKKTEIIR